MNKFLILTGLLLLITSNLCISQTSKLGHYVLETSDNDEDFTSKVYDILQKSNNSELTIEFGQ